MKKSRSNPIINNTSLLLITSGKKKADVCVTNDKCEFRETEKPDAAKGHNKLIPGKGKVTGKTSGSNSPEVILKKKK